MSQLTADEIAHLIDLLCDAGDHADNAAYAEKCSELVAKLIYMQDAMEAA